MARRSAPSSCSSPLPPWRSPLVSSRWVKSFACLSVEHGDPALVAVAVASVGAAGGRGPAGSDPDRGPDELHQLVDACLSPEGLSLRWYSELFTNPQWTLRIPVSVETAFAT